MLKNKYFTLLFLFIQFNVIPLHRVFEYADAIYIRVLTYRLGFFYFAAYENGLLLR